MSLTTSPVADVAPPFVTAVYDGPPADLAVAPVFDVAAPFILPAAGGGDPGPATLREAVRSLLRESPAVVALVGQRIRYARSRQRDREPRVTYLVPSRTFGRDLDGPDETSEARVRVSAWADDSVQAEDLAEAVRQALDGFVGWVGAVYIASIDYEASVDLPEWDGDGGEATTYQIAIDFMFDHRVEVPSRG